MTDHLTQLGRERDTIRAEIARLSQNDARVHRLSESERTEQVLALEDDLRRVQAEIQQVSEAQNARLLNQTYGTAPVAEDTERAMAELKLAEEALTRSLDQFTSQTRGYCRKLRESQQAVFSAAANAGQPVRRPDMVMSALAERLAGIVRDTVKYG